jgi:hypothetical protein
VNRTGVSAVSQNDAILSENIGHPGPMDIVMGGGRNSKSSIGHLCFRNVVEQSARIAKFSVNSVVRRELLK